MALVAFSAAVFLVRGPLHGVQHAADYMLIYSPARAWITGANPYDLEQVDQAWMSAGGAYEQRPSVRVTAGLLYPPSTPAALAPFAAFAWPLARTVWAIANTLFFGVAVWGVARLAGFRLHQRRTWLFVSAALLFTPVHTAIRHGQTTLYVLAPLALAAVLLCPLARGALLALATLIKPHLGLPFVAYTIINRDWRSLTSAAVVCAVITGVAIVPMTMRDVPWFESWMHNLQTFSTAGEGDPTRANPIRHQLVNLHYPLHTLIDNRTVVQGIVLATLGIIAAAFFFWRSPHRPPVLLSLSMIAVLSLMVAYHRFYDAVFLIFPLAWAISRLAACPRHRLAWCVVMLTIPYFVNMATMLFVAAQNQWLPGALTNSSVWEILIMPIQAWALLGMAGCLLAARFFPDGEADALSKCSAASARCRPPQSARG